MIQTNVKSRKKVIGNGTDSSITVEATRPFSISVYHTETDRHFIGFGSMEVYRDKFILHFTKAPASGEFTVRWYDDLDQPQSEPDGAEKEEVMVNNLPLSKNEKAVKREALVGLSDMLLWGVVAWACYVDKNIFVSGMATGFAALGLKRLIESYAVFHVQRRKKI